MNDVAVYGRVDRLPVNNEADSYFTWAKELANCPHYKRLGTGGILAILLNARELELPPMACLNGGLYQIDGRVSLSGQMINLLLLRRGHKADIKKLTDKECIIEFTRCGSTTSVEYKYTWDDVVKAGMQNKDNYKKNPRDMLFNRCLSGGARKICPDALVGPLYCHGELENDGIQGDNCVESIVSKSGADEASEKEVNQISFEKVEGFDEFIKKHAIDQADTEKHEYIKICAKACEKSFDEIVNFAVTNEKRFITGFENWKKENLSKEQTENKESDSIQEDTPALTSQESDQYLDQAMS